MKRKLWIILVLTALIAALWCGMALADTSGSCGEQVTWNLDSSGVLTISGTGDMTDYGRGSSPWFSDRDSIVSVIVTDGVTSIGKYSFYGASNLTSAVIPASIQKIGTSAFNGCFYLTKFVIPNPETVIDSLAFEGCDNLTLYGNEGSTAQTYANDNIISFCAISGTSGGVNWALNPGTGVLTISGSTMMDDFSYDHKPYWYEVREMITSAVIQNDIKYIGAYAFLDCSNLTEVSLSGSVSSIHNDAFSGCVNLESFHVDSGSGSFSSVNGVLYNRDQTWIMRCPVRYSGPLILPDGIEGINGGAFSMCTELTAITMPGGLTSIGQSAFDGCSGLTAVSLPESLTSIAYGAFSGCTGLSAVVIPGSVTTIKGSVFSQCTGLTAVTILPGVTKIEGSCFYGCTNLTDVTVPASVTAIGDSAFSNCSKLTHITLPANLTEISRKVFNSCSSLKEITIPDGVTKIKTSAFNECSSLTGIVIPNSVDTIETNAFRSCTNLSIVTICNPNASIGGFVFYDCAAGLVIRGWEDSTAQTYANNYSITFLVTMGSCGDSAIWALDPDIGVLTISGSTMMDDFSYDHKPDWYGVREMITSAVIQDDIRYIGAYAFLDCSNLTEVSLSGSVSSIHNDAFSGCVNLESFHVDSGSGSFSSVNGVLYNRDQTWIMRCPARYSGPLILPDGIEGINGQAFSMCTGLTAITFPEGLTSIGMHAFDGCSGLTAVSLPESLTSIGFGAFSGCTGLSAVVIPGSVTSIKGDAFSGCTGLTAVTILPGVTKIEGDCFYGCTNLTDVTVPASVTVIGDSAFMNCSKLAHITLPANLTEISRKVFKSCSSLKEITIPDSVTKIKTSAFEECSSLTSIVIPNSVGTIETNAFRSCTNLSIVTICNPNASIGGFAFKACATGLVIRGWEDSTAQTYATNNDITFLALHDPTFFLPTALTKINSGSFLGISAGGIVIPKNVTEITGNPFEGSSLTTVYGYPGSAAETFANTYGFFFISIDDAWMASH